MPLIQAVKAVCDRLGPLGWRDLLLRVTGNQLDIRQRSTADLQTALLADIAAIDRNFPGFEDFSREGRQAITPRSPAQSLLYHALASPGVAIGINGPLTVFPTMHEIEMVENFVFGVKPPSLAELKQLAGISGSNKLSIVLFAYEYRSARDTCFGLHADLTFSRTGISRVGTCDAQYAARGRGFQSEVPDDPFAFSVCPSKFGAFLAVRRSGSSPDFRPMRPQDGDKKRDFWVPVHKLFDGPECLKGIDLEVGFKAFHYNDKIRRIQVVALKKKAPTTKPFRLTDGIASFLDEATMGPGVLCPIVHPRLVEPAQVDGKFLTFRVPPSDSAFAALEPGAEERDGAEVRPAPAYVHARTKVDGTKLIDLNNDPAHPDVLDTVQKGNYDALHYLDFTGDGFIDVDIPALSKKPEVDAVPLQAYSLVAAPDFSPLQASGNLQNGPNLRRSLIACGKKYGASILSLSAIQDFPATCKCLITGSIRMKPP